MCIPVTTFGNEAHDTFSLGGIWNYNISLPMFLLSDSLAAHALESFYFQLRTPQYNQNTFHKVIIHFTLYTQTVIFIM